MGSPPFSDQLQPMPGKTSARRGLTLRPAELSPTMKASRNRLPRTLRHCLIACAPSGVSTSPTHYAGSANLVTFVKSEDVTLMDDRPAAKWRAFPRGIAEVLRAMETEPTRKFTISDLASIAKVSTRTLQRQFRIFVGKSPLATLQDVRVDYARRALLLALPHASVSEIAHRSGFGHLGRFSHHYRERFGEPPSRTLHRQRDILRSVRARVNTLTPRDD
jgi:AraC-like DNA-binding protein